MPQHRIQAIATVAVVAVIALVFPASAGAQTIRPSARDSIKVQPACAAPNPGTWQCYALRRTDIPGRSPNSVTPASPPSGYGPADLQSAYNLPSSTAGTGLTVAIVDAYDLPTAETDLAVYRSQYGLAACTTANGCFRKVNQSGGSTPPAADSGWGAEIALDMDMVSAVCPNCHILLVEADSSSMSDLGTAVDTAVSMGAVAVSNSYGGPEVGGLAAAFDADYHHPGVAVTVSTGDCGYDCSGNFDGYVSYPAASRYVVAVGGTSLSRATNARGWTESAWGSSLIGWGAGSGCSTDSAKPSWQQDTGCAMRTQADVSAVADPETGVAVYGAGSWQVFGGTSASSPIIAGVYALAGGPGAGDQAASYLYADAADLYDVVGGSSAVDETCGSSYLCNAVAGYDGPTGLGTPNGVGAFTAPSSGGDLTPPTVTKPVAGMKVGAKLGLGNSLISWTGSDAGTGIASYELQESIAGGAWTDVTLAHPTSTSVQLALPLGQPARFRVRATDGASNVSTWKTGLTLTPVLHQDTDSAIVYTTGWTTATDLHASGGTRTYAIKKFSKATFSFTGSAVAFVAVWSPYRGQANVLLDGTLVSTINLYRATSSQQRISFAYAWPTAGSHTIRIGVVGTPGHPKVDVDAFLVYQ